MFQLFKRIRMTAVDLRDNQKYCFMFLLMLLISASLVTSGHIMLREYMVSSES